MGSTSSSLLARPGHRIPITMVAGLLIVSLSGCGSTLRYAGMGPRLGMRIGDGAIVGLETVVGKSEKLYMYGSGPFGANPGSGWLRGHLGADLLLGANVWWRAQAGWSPGRHMGGYFGYAFDAAENSSMVWGSWVSAAAARGGETDYNSYMSPACWLGAGSCWFGVAIGWRYVAGKHEVFVSPKWYLATADHWSGGS